VCWPFLRPPALRSAQGGQAIREAARARRERAKPAYWQALDDATSRNDAKQRLQRLATELDMSGFTAASACLLEDLDALVVHLRYPIRHRRRWRSTNLLERSLGEVRRRTKVIGRFPGETSCLTLVWAVLDLVITYETNGIRFTQLDHQHLDRHRYREPDQEMPEEVTAA
jgi:putative transposase